MTQASKKYFGTDGIRAQVGQAPMNLTTILRLAQALGVYLNRLGSNPRVVMGKDTRLSGTMIESTLAAGLTSQGIEVYLLGVMPTPGVAYLTRTFHAQLGIVISASHNPHQDNGIKFFGSNGEKLPDDQESAIEEAMNQALVETNPNQLGHQYPCLDAPGRYIEFCKSSVPAFFSLKGYKIAIDCAHGATVPIAPQVFRELKADVITIGTEPSGLNINQDVGSTAPQKLQETVVEQKCDFGIALDGDGDRVILVDHQGQIVDGDQILYILARDLFGDKDHGNKGVVGTQMSNLGLEVALQKHQIPFHRAAVGDRHVMAELRKSQWLIGGESSGHIIWLQSNTTGDGIVAALQIAHIMQKTKKHLPELLKDLTPYPQTLINLPLAQKLQPQIQAQLDHLATQTNLELGEQGRVLLRPSGTEPLLRIMVEANDKDLADNTCQNLAKRIKDLISSLS